MENSYEFLSRQQEQRRRYDSDDEYTRDTPPMPSMHDYNPPDERKQRELTNPYTHYDSIDSPNDDDPRRRMDERYVNELESRLDSYKKQESMGHPGNQRRYDDYDRQPYDKPDIIDNEYDNSKGFVNGFEVS